MAVKNKVKTYSWLAVISMIVNYAVGTGILNLPHTIASASIGVAVIFIAFLSFLSYLLGQYTLELDSMSFALIRAGKIETPGKEQLAEEVIQEGTTNVFADSQLNGSVGDTQKPDYSIPNTVVYQMSTLCGFYGGRPAFYIYQISVTIFFFGILWSYGSVISQSLTSVIPMTALPNHVKGSAWVCSDPCDNYAQACSDSYWIWICITMVFSCVMVFFNLGEQKVMQAIFTTCRFLELGLTAILIIYCLASQPFLNKNIYTGSTYVNPNIKYFAWDTAAFGSLVSSITFTQVYHHSLPSIFQFTRYSSQKRIPMAIMISNIFLAAITVLLPLPGALYFGNDGTNLVVINFNQWNGSGFNGGKQPGFVAFLSYLIRILPPIYVLGAIPINALTMSLNIQEMIPLKQRQKLWVKIIVNLMCVIPAMILAGFVRCLGVIIDFTGLLGYVLMIAPALCMIKAQKVCKRVFGTDKQNRCTFSLCLSQQWLMWIIVVVNAISFVLTVYSLIAGLIKKP